MEKLMWVEKYRPKNLNEIFDQKHVIQRLEGLLANVREMPHMLFAGPPGTGKTSTALVVARQILGEEYWRDYTLELNASDERGINIVRERVKTFARYSHEAIHIPFRIVILDESDEMCLDPETTVLTGKLDDLKEVTLKELYEKYGDETFCLPTFNSNTMQPEEDLGRIVNSSTADLYKITFEDGRSVVASSEHPFFRWQNGRLEAVKTTDIRRGSELADFKDKFLRCYNCDKIFYEAYAWKAYKSHFCSIKCRDSFFSSLSELRTVKEGSKISVKNTASLKGGGGRRRHYQSKEYGRKRSEILRRVRLSAGISGLNPPFKFNKQEEVGLGRRPTDSQKSSTCSGVGRFFEEQPEGLLLAAKELSKSSEKEDETHGRRDLGSLYKDADTTYSEYLGKMGYWRGNHSRSKITSRMAELLDKWRIRYDRERVILGNAQGHPYSFIVDFLINERIALLVNGCWLHVCPTCKVKLEHETQRQKMVEDYRCIAELERLGYKVAVVWEHELKRENLIQSDILPRIFEIVGISGGALSKTENKCKVNSVEYVGHKEVLNISVSRNKNFFLSNGILTHNTSDAQTALRRVMEESSKICRFILIANYSSNIIEPIQSRCAIFRFSNLAEPEVVEYLESICKKENVAFTREGLKQIYMATEGDLRHALNMLQAIASLGEITDEAVQRVAGLSAKSRVSEVVNEALAGNFKRAREKMIELLKVYGMSETDFLKYANEELLTHLDYGQEDLAEITAKYDYRITLGSTPDIQLTAFLAELAYIGKQKEKMEEGGRISTKKPATRELFTE
jgi:replication factor C small subunit